MKLAKPEKETCLRCGQFSSHIVHDENNDLAIQGSDGKLYVEMVYPIHSFSAAMPKASRKGESGVSIAHEIKETIEFLDAIEEALAEKGFTSFKNGEMIKHSLRLNKLYRELRGSAEQGKERER